ncbi:MAG: type II toxin-antitoxin system RelE/ParE family toxin [Candidatus Hydrogenedentes bacterium]|nr:type II toxin-antitoxin system RelE/ParE family toxin [Candidatus Hydrogenedentota bacterium]
MIRSIKHRGLKRLYERGDTSGLTPEHLPRIEEALGHLDAAVRPSGLDLPGYRLHALKGKLRGFWSVRISGNFRLIFRMEDGDAYDVNLVDYH